MRPTLAGYLDRPLDRGRRAHSLRCRQGPGPALSRRLTLPPGFPAKGAGTNPTGPAAERDELPQTAGQNPPQPTATGRASDPRVCSMLRTSIHRASAHQPPDRSPPPARPTAREPIAWRQPPTLIPGRYVPRHSPDRRSCQALVIGNPAFASPVSPSRSVWRAGCHGARRRALARERAVRLVTWPPVRPAVRDGERPGWWRVRGTARRQRPRAAGPPQWPASSSMTGANCSMKTALTAT
jgi:hypothetical protein